MKQQILDTLVRTPLLIGLLPAPICLIKPRLIAISGKFLFVIQYWQIAFLSSALMKAVKYDCYHGFSSPQSMIIIKGFIGFGKNRSILNSRFFPSLQQARSVWGARLTIGLSCSILRDRIMICLAQPPLLNNHSRLLTCKNYNNRNKYMVSTSPSGHQVRIYEVFERQARSQLCFSSQIGADANILF